MISTQKLVKQMLSLDMTTHHATKLKTRQALLAALDAAIEIDTKATITLNT